MTLVSPYFWYVLLAIPSFAAYKALQVSFSRLAWAHRANILFTGIRDVLAHVQFAGPWLKDWMSGTKQSQPQLDESTRRRLEKTEKRAERRRMKWR